MTTVQITFPAREAQPTLYSALCPPMYRPVLRVPPGEAETRMVIVGARAGLAPIGLAMAEVFAAETTACLASVVVRPSYRRQAIASRMVDVLCGELQALGQRRLTVGLAQADVKDADRDVLHGFEFNGPQIRGECFEFAAPTVIASYPPGRRRLPRAFSCIPWLDTPSSMRVPTGFSDEGPSRYPSCFSPFRHQHLIVPEISLALVASDQVVGWVIAHRQNASAIYYSSLYVRPDLVRLGVGGGLLLSALDRHARHACARHIPGRLTVLHASKRMKALLDRRFSRLVQSRSPYIEFSRELETTNNN